MSQRKRHHSESSAASLSSTAASSGDGGSGSWRSKAGGRAISASRLRARRLLERCRVELRNPPEALAEELGDASLTEAFAVYDAVRRGAVSRTEPA